MVSSARSQAGFTYLGILIAVAIMGISLTAVGTLWQTASKREKEKELLFIGYQFRNAIKQYYHRTPGVSMYPKDIKTLLKDPRFLSTTRHLRKIYTDPMTGKAEWGLIKTPDGGIMGVYSLSKTPPLKKSRFRSEDKGFETAKSYSDWRFIYQPATSAVNQPYY